MSEQRVWKRTRRRATPGLHALALALTLLALDASCARPGTEAAPNAEASSANAASAARVTPEGAARADGAGGAGSPERPSTPTTAGNASEGGAVASLHSGPLELRDDSTGVLLTWVEPSGSFRVGDSVASVPEARRGAVRVVFAGREEGTGDTVFVTDLTQRGPDGAYALDRVSRASWLQRGKAARVAEARRVLPQKALSVDGTPQKPSSPPATEPATERSLRAGTPTAGESAANAKVTAIIYGASWCKPCADAARHLHALGVHVVKKDIEEDDAAREEMTAKLLRIGSLESSIPVIDVGGQVLVGYSPSALDAAVAKARARQTR